MDLDAVMDELGQALDTIDGLRVAIVGEKPLPPAAYISYPEGIQYDGTYGRGTDTMDLQAVVIVGQTKAKNTRRLLAAYCDGNDTGSVKTMLEAFDYQTCDSVTVPSVDFDVIRLGAIDYMAAMFAIHVVGSGQ